MQQAPGEGCGWASPTLWQQSWFGSCLLPPAATAMPPCPRRRATTPFPRTGLAAHLTTGKLGECLHVEFKNKTFKRAPCSLKKNKNQNQIPKKSPPSQNISQVWHKAQPRQKLNQLGEEAAPASAEEEGERPKELGAGWKPLNSTLPRKERGTAPRLTVTLADRGQLQAY